MDVERYLASWQELKRTAGLGTDDDPMTEQTTQETVAEVGSPLPKAIADAAGWLWCEQHQRPRFKGNEPCDRLHRSAPMTTQEAEAMYPEMYDPDPDFPPKP